MSKFSKFIAAGLLSVGIVESPRACMSNPQATLKTSKIGEHFRSGKRRPANTDPAPFAEGSSTPSLESELGNHLLKVRAAPRTVLSIPALIQRSEYKPFGDAQSNSKMSFGSAWTDREFPVVGIETTSADGKKTREYRFASKLKVTGFDESSLPGGWWGVKPKGWSDSFYFNFNTGRHAVSEFLKGVPANLRSFSGGRTAPDPERVAGAANVLELLKSKGKGPGYNTDPWFFPSVHGTFPSAEGPKTALGGILTWGIVSPEFGPFKQLYTCFEARDIAGEKKSGVPSGAGWHHIGDPAESLFNNLENAALPVAVARTHGNGAAAYGLTESITASWLAPGEVLISPQNEFHWYLNPYEKEVCTEIWVHKCVPGPTNNWGMGC